VKPSRRRLPKHDLGAHFLTTKTFHNTPYFRDPECAGIFCQELEAARVRYGFHVLAFVVMPDHVHLLLWWDAASVPDLVISKVAWAVKGKSARRIVDYLRSKDAGMGGDTTRVGDGNAVAHPQPMLQPVREPVDKPHHRNWRYKIWQQGAGYDFNIYTRRKLIEKIAYIHANPLRAGLVPTPERYPWSSASDYAGHPALHSVKVIIPTEVL